jgi:hypothetical protein
MKEMSACHLDEKCNLLMAHLSIVLRIFAFLERFCQRGGKIRLVLGAWNGKSITSEASISVRMVLILVCFLTLVWVQVGSENILPHERPSGLDQTIFGVNTLIDPEKLQNPFSPHYGPMPLPRVHQTSTMVGNYVIIFGGYDTEGNFLDDIHLYDRRTGGFSGPIIRLASENTEGEIVNLIGNNRVNTEFNQYRSQEDQGLPSGDTPRVFRPGFEGDPPLKRAEHAAASVDGQFYIFGGNSALGLLNDLYRFDIKQLTWWPVVPGSGATPSRRAGHALCATPSRDLVLFGGRGQVRRTGSSSSSSSSSSISAEFTSLNDVWRFSPSRGQWTLLSQSDRLSARTTATAPAGRAHAAVGMIGHRLFVYGGKDASTDILFDDVWAFHLEVGRWTFIPKAGGLAPPPLQMAHLLPFWRYRDKSTRGTDEGQQFPPDEDGFILYGGIGGGGYCGGKLCGQTETVIGQLYRFSLKFGKHVSTHIQADTGGSISSLGETDYIRVDSAYWNYTRLTDAEATGMNGSKRRKQYAYESVAVFEDENTVYEFGGLQAVDPRLKAAGQNAVNRNSPVISLESGGPLENEQQGVVRWDYEIIHNDNANWDYETGEPIQGAVGVVTNGAWTYEDAFVQSQPQAPSSHVGFLPPLRVFQVTPRSMILQFEERPGDHARGIPAQEDPWFAVDSTPVERQTHFGSGQRTGHNI